MPPPTLINGASLDGDETAPLVRANDGIGRRPSLRLLGASIASLAAILALLRAYDVTSLLRGARHDIRVAFSVDVGCVPLHVINESPIEDFFEHDITGVTLQLKGAPPHEFGGVYHRAHFGHKLTRSGFSTVFSGEVTVPRRAEYGFALHNANEQTIFELGYNPRFPHRGNLMNDTCTTEVHAGGGVYRNRVLPHSVGETMTRRPDGVYEISTTYAGCRKVCPLTVKLIATVSPDGGDADNVFGIEESKAATDAWRPYKGHFTQVSAGEFNTWGLDSNTGALAWTRNADLNPFDRANWQSATNNAQHLSYSPDGPVVDFDAGYTTVYGVTATIDSAGGRVWMRPVDGSGDWRQAGEYTSSRLVQVTAGRSFLWGTNAVSTLYKCPDPCGPGSVWQNGGLTSIKQIEVGDTDAFAVHNDGLQLSTSREDGVGGWSALPLPTGFTTTVDQVAVGATGLWMLDARGKLWACTLPCAGGSDFSLISTAPDGIISIDAGKVPHEDN